MVLKEPAGNPLLSPAGLEAASALAEEVLAEEDEIVVVVVVDGEDKAAAGIVVVVVLDVDELFVVVLVEALGGGATSDLVGWASLDETMLLELEVSVPEDAAAEAPKRATVSRRLS
jgi:hypothetical protein